MLVIGVPSFAQQSSSPHIGYVYPAGGRQGTSFPIKVGGQFLDGATNVYVSGEGIRAAVLDYDKPLTPQQANALRDKLRELQDKRQTNSNWTATDTKTLAEIRQKLATFQRRPQNPAIAETVSVQVTLSPDAEPGARELRVGSRLGLSNPMKFCVGQLLEFRKAEARDNQPQARFRPQRNNNEPRATPPTETRITIPAVVNGQTLPGGTDRFRFSAHAGQHLVIVTSARDLIPYLPDAVPGWFQAAVTLYDSQGKELAYADHFRFHPDPVLYYEVSKDGEYLLEIRDSVYRGREDFVYRITIGELPFLTSMFPLGGHAGGETTLELTGWNLPQQLLTQTNRESLTAICPISVRRDDRVSNCLPFAVDNLPECFEQEPNDSPAQAQAVTLPVIINGKVNQPGDCDVFRFSGRAGEEIVAEVYARRLDSPLDSVLKLSDATGHQIAFNDDAEDKGSGLDTHHADSYLRVKLPADGLYFLHLTDAQHQGGAEYGYRLRISAPRPDFALRVVPSSVTARPGSAVPITVYALRKDGFTNDIVLALVGAPAGFSLSGARIPANADQVRFTLTAPSFARMEPYNLSLQGRAIIDGDAVVHPAIPAEDMMQAFAYRHLVPAREWLVAVHGNGRWPARGVTRVLSQTPIKIPAGGTGRVQLATPSGAFADRFELALNEPPEGIALAKTSPDPAGEGLVVEIDAAKAKPGLQGNLIFNVFPGKNFAQPQKAKAAAANRRAAIGTLPAIPFEVVNRK